jgi:hypothetical protein
MSKRPGSATEANPPKRTRKPAGFRAARATSALQANSFNSTLFVTVTQPNERGGTLKAQSRIFSDAPEPPAPSSNPAPSSPSSTPATHPNLPEPAIDTQHDDALDTLDPLAEIEVSDPKPKRKRYTKNAVSYCYAFWAFFIKKKPPRIDLPNGSSFETRF